jgi:hypothetical protein
LPIDTFPAKQLSDGLLMQLVNTDTLTVGTGTTSGAAPPPPQEIKVGNTKANKTKIFRIA